MRLPLLSSLTCISTVSCSHSYLAVERNNNHKRLSLFLVVAYIPVHYILVQPYLFNVGFSTISSTLICSPLRLFPWLSSLFLLTTTLSDSVSYAVHNSPSILSPWLTVWPPPMTYIPNVSIKSYHTEWIGFTCGLPNRPSPHSLPSHPTRILLMLMAGFVMIRNSLLSSSDSYPHHLTLWHFQISWDWLLGPEGLCGTTFFYRFSCRDVYQKKKILPGFCFLKHCCIGPSVVLKLIVHRSI